MKICICGGGSLGHVISAWTASRLVAGVSVYTHRPRLWTSCITADTPSGEIIKGRLACVSGDPGKVIPDADVVLLCYPGFMIERCLREIGPFLKADAFVGAVVSSTGFFFEAQKILSPMQPLWGFQRAPFIARVAEYGRSAHLLGLKNSLKVAVENVSDARKAEFTEFLSEWFGLPVTLLASHYEASLTNSNPLLHPARLYDLFGGENEGRVYEEQPLFYEQWSERASQYLISLDRELFALLDVLPVSPGFLPTILDYYESTDAASLAAKLRSIPAFRGIPAPAVKTAAGWVPDTSSRYFQEDFPYGLRYICELAREKGVEVPVMDSLLAWGLRKCK